MQVSSFLRFGAALALVGGLAACQQPGYGYNTATGLSPDAQRAAIGAVGGAITAKALGENVATGAALGATAGALCDEVGVCAQ